jgi:hypothetical protein
LTELVGLADRILVFYRGRLALDLDGAAITDNQVLHAINAGALVNEGARPDSQTQGQEASS